MKYTPETRFLCTSYHILTHWLPKKIVRSFLSALICVHLSTLREGEAPTSAVKIQPTMTTDNLTISDCRFQILDWRIS